MKYSPAWIITTVDGQVSNRLTHLNVMSSCRQTGLCDSIEPFVHVTRVNFYVVKTSLVPRVRRGGGVWCVCVWGGVSRLDDR